MVTTMESGMTGASSGSPAPAAASPVFTTEAEKQAARVVMDVIGKYEVKRDLVPTSSALLKPEVQKEILAEVAERLKPLQGDLLAGVDPAAALEPVCRGGKDHGDRGPADHRHPAHCGGADG
jgi:type III restriction enzyme